jgi:hypothetical protein
MEFQKHAALYHTIQRTIKNPKHNFWIRVQDIKHQLEDCERKIISRTKNSISLEDQANGKLIQCVPLDPQMINNSSIQFFNLIYEICSQMNLSKMVPVLCRANICERDTILQQKKLPGMTSTIISKQLADVMKCDKSIHQRIEFSKDLPDDRKIHIKAIEMACNRILFDHMNEYQDVVLETQGREEYENYTRNIKRQIIESNCKNVMEMNEKIKSP